MSPSTDTASGPLAGLKVLDLSRVLAGPWSTQVLGDLGAEVIKLEQPGKGDDTRAWGPPYAHDPDDRLSGYYLACNRNKRSIAIDITNPEGAALIRRLAADSDVVIENFKTGGLAKYGLDHASLRALNPGLVYCSITGFGLFGPYADRGGYDFLIQGMGGLMSVTGPAEGEPGSGPTKVGVPVIDLFTGLYATISILAALRHRDLTGQGQHIDCALLDTSVAILANQGMNHLLGGAIPQPMGNGHPNVVPYRNFATADGEVIVAVGNDGQFRKLCQVLERDDLGRDPRFATNSSRVAHRVDLEAELSASLSGWPRAGLLSEMTAAGVPGGPINRLDQVFADPQVQVRAMVERHGTENGDDLPFTRFPALLSETPARIRTLPPKLGEHTAEILQDWLGLTGQEIRSLAESGAVAGKISSEALE